MIHHAESSCIDNAIYTYITLSIHNVIYIALYIYNKKGGGRRGERGETKQQMKASVD